MRHVRVLIAAFAAMLAGQVCLSGEMGGIVRSERRYDRERRPMRYYVFQVMGVSGQMTFEVVSDLEKLDKQKDYKKEYENALLEWMKAKREAQKKKEEFTDEKPKGPQLIKTLKSFTRKADADEYAEKMQKQWDAMLEKKAAKEAAKAEGEGKTEEGREEAKKEAKKNEE